MNSVFTHVDIAQSCISVYIYIYIYIYTRRHDFRSTWPWSEDAWLSLHDHAHSKHLHACTLCVCDRQEIKVYSYHEEVLTCQ